VIDRQILVALSESRDRIATGCADPLCLDHLAREANYSPFHFHRLFKSVYGETPMGFLAQRRLELAQRLLRETDDPVWMIALEVGYSSDTSFVGWFRARTGCSPSEYRRGARLSFQVGRLWSPVYVPGCFFGPTVKAYSAFSKIRELR